MIRNYDWPHDIADIASVDIIGHELAYFKYSEVKDHETVLQKGRDPHKLDFFVLMLCSAGSIHGRINLEEHDIASPSIVRIMPGQIVSVDEASDDFDASILVMSHNFIENLLVYINGQIPIDGRWRDNCVTKLGDEDMKMQINFFNIMRRIVRIKDNPYRLKMVEHLIMVFFYNSHDMLDAIKNNRPQSSADILSKEFLALVKDYFKKERQLRFYADRLFITPRYLSRVVKESSGSSAAEWIERYVVLEARALLKSTNMTIQQISDELNFPSQTFFGKYFKRRVGMSPKEYRRRG